MACVLAIVEGALIESRTRFKGFGDEMRGEEKRNWPKALL
jgi:hypothetical protein